MTLEKFIINGSRPLKGVVDISGAKNSAAAILPASLVLDGPCRIENVPDILDVTILKKIMTKLGAVVRNEGRNTLYIDPTGVNSCIASYRMVNRLRASYYLIGALLAKKGKAVVSYPGGCNFGFRPIDQHIKGFEAMGANVSIEQGLIKASTSELRGAQIYLDVVSVGATINLMIAATKARGVTVIENAAKEPHVVDVANFLNAMGADIRGAGTDVIKIRGVEKLPGGATHMVIPDMVEAGTFMIAAAATCGDVVVRNIIPKHMDSLTAKLIEMGVEIMENGDWIRVLGTRNLKRANIKTLPYPGFPTDLHPQIATLLCLARGTSTITESIWDLRFQYVDELKRMGANIKVEGRMAVIEGIPKFSGAPVKATDLRAGAALVIAGLAAEGTTEVIDISYIDRGYEDFEIKLRSLGADITRVEE